MTPSDPHEAHEAGDAFASTSRAAGRQFRMNPRSPIGAVACPMNLLDVRAQLGVSVRASGRLAAPPRESTRSGRHRALGRAS
jgi:hypothetical protein